MKRFLLTMCAILTACGALALDVNTSTKTLNLTTMSDEWNDFRFKWNGYDSQSVIFTVVTNSGATQYYTMTGLTATFRADKQVSGGTNITYISNGASDCTISGSNVSFTVAYTNVPPNGTYKAELILIDSGNGQYRTLGRGTILVRESLYANDGSDFTFPSLTSTLGDLADVNISGEAQGDVLYYGGTMWTNLPAGTSGKFLMTQGASANPTWSSVVAGAADMVTNVVGDSEFMVTGAGGHVVTGAIASTITRDTELTTATGACAIAWAAADTSATANCITGAVGTGICVATVGNRIVTNAVTEADTLATVLGRGADADNKAISNIGGSLSFRDTGAGLDVLYLLQAYNTDSLLMQLSGDSSSLLFGGSGGAYFPGQVILTGQGIVKIYQAANLCASFTNGNVIVPGTISEGGSLLSAKYYGIANPSNYLAGAAVTNIVTGYSYVTESVTNGLESSAHASVTYSPKTIVMPWAACVTILPTNEPPWQTVGLGPFGCDVFVTGCVGQTWCSGSTALVYAAECAAATPPNTAWTTNMTLIADNDSESDATAYTLDAGNKLWVFCGAENGASNVNICILGTNLVVQP